MLVVAGQQELDTGLVLDLDALGFAIPDQPAAQNVLGPEMICFRPLVDMGIRAKEDQLHRETALVRIEELPVTVVGLLGEHVFAQGRCRMICRRGAIGLSSGMSALKLPSLP